MTGDRLAHYALADKLGEGGMGTVYRARDTKLDRDVALKFLPATMALDAERIARFEREARTLASLNHPNVAAIYGFEEDQGKRFLVMELVEGVDLAERLTRGAIPLDEALDIARQIAEGLEEAHEQGIVHRDLKPANIKLTPDGKVKILDFGLARAYQGGAVNESEILDSPTITAMTQVGVILGTAAYMSPEQAKGKPVDRRADLWAFGVILWEMLTGKRLFDGEDASDTLAAVLRQDPPWDQLPSDTPAQVKGVLERCLERDPRRRLRDIGETRIRLEEWTRHPDSLIRRGPKEETKRAPLSFIPWALALAGIAGAVFFALQPGGTPDQLPRPPRAVLDILMPEGAPVSTNAGINVQISPQGTHIAYRTPEGIRIRAMDQRESRLLDGTSGTLQFTFSPDGQWIAFMANSRLMRVSTTGGAATPITEANLVSRGLCWVNESTIVFTPNFFGGLHAVSLDTGELRVLTEPDTTRGERSHRWPVPLPGGNSVLFLCQYEGRDYDEGDIRVVGLDGQETTVYRGGAAPAYAQSGHLLYVQDNSVFAIPFDPGKRQTSGLGIPVLTGVWARVNDQESDDGSAQYFVSPQGTLIYRTQSGRGNTNLSRLELATGAVQVLADATEISSAQISPDDRTLAIHPTGEGVFLVELESGMRQRFTFGAHVERVGAFSPDSKRLYWMRSQGGGRDYQLMTRPVDGSTPEEVLLTHERMLVPQSVSPDGRALLCAFWNDQNQWDVGLVDLEHPERGVRGWVGGPGDQHTPRFSPDGRWVVYVSTESSTSQTLIRRFPDTGVQWELGPGVGVQASFNWVENGTALIIRSGRGVFRIPVNLAGDSPIAGRPEKLDDGWSVPPPQTGARTVFSSDGKYGYGFDLIPASDVDDRIILDTDWFTELERLAPAGR